MRLPIIPSLSPWSYRAPFPRYGDLLAETCVFFLPFSHSAPPLHVFPLEFRGQVNHEETKAMGLSSPHNHSLSYFDMIPDCDRRTDRWTDGRNLSQLIQRSA